MTAKLSINTIPFALFKYGFNETMHTLIRCGDNHHLSKLTFEHCLLNMVIDKPIIKITESEYKNWESGLVRVD